MINIVLQGGLGNQMFQYALGRSLELRGRTVTYDLSRVHRFGDERPHDRRRAQYGLDGFNTHVIEGVPMKPHYASDGVQYDDTAFSWLGPGTLQGYWQSEKFFAAVKYTIEREFHPVKAWDSSILPDGWFLDGRTCLQVRRGDYVQYADFHGLLDADYYWEGLRVVGGKHVIVFTDDPEWVQANEKAIFNGRSWVLGNTGNRHFDITLMSMCPRMVMANSSFGWWGAWLGDFRNRADERKVVAPKRWFGPINTMYDGDIVPERWTKI